MPEAAKCFIFAVFALFAAAAGAKSEKPNFLIIVADDLGYSDLGCYGGEIKTPNLDGLASRGVRYTDFYNTARCWTSRSALMCGYHHTQLGVEPNLKKYPRWARSIAHLLKEGGYKSYHSGKWHVYPLKRAIADAGFDRSYLIDDHDRNFNPKIHYLDDVPLPPVGDRQKYYSTIAITDYMLSFISEHAANWKDKPFFAYLAYIVPHFPLQASASDIAEYRGKYDQGWEKTRAKRFEKLMKLGFPETWRLSKVERENTPPYLRFKQKAVDSFGDNEVFNIPEWNALTLRQRAFQAKKMEIHAAMVHRMDIEIGRVLKKLDELGMLDNTVVMFLSDNGASAEIMVRGDNHNPGVEPGAKGSYLCLGPGWGNVSNTPFRKYKVWTHEGGVSTPFIAAWGNNLKNPGSINRTPAHITDLMPTILSMAGIKKDRSSSGAPKFPGKDISENIKSGSNVDRDFIYFSHEGNKALRMGDWKILYSNTREPAENKTWRLFNLSDDRAEQFNLSERYPERKSLMVRRWEELQKEYLTDSVSGASEE